MRHMMYYYFGTFAIPLLVAVAAVVGGWAGIVYFDDAIEVISWFVLIVGFLMCFGVFIKMLEKGNEKGMFDQDET